MSFVVLKNSKLLLQVSVFFLLILFLLPIVFQKSQLDDQLQSIKKFKENEKKLKADLYRIESINKEYMAQINILKNEVKEISKQVEKTVPLELKESAREEIQYVTSTPGDTRKIQAKVIAAIVEHNLIMLSVGKAEGVKVGDRFTVFRADEYIGKVYIIEVHPNMSAARIIEELNNSKGLKIERRDDAKLGF